MPRDKTINILVDFGLLARFLLVVPDPVVGFLRDGRLVQGGQRVRGCRSFSFSPVVDNVECRADKCFVDSIEDCMILFPT